VCSIRDVIQNHLTQVRAETHTTKSLPQTAVRGLRSRQEERLHTVLRVEDKCFDAYAATPVVLRVTTVVATQLAVRSLTSRQEEGYM
jgi:hypothetical protein